MFSIPLYWDSGPRLQAALVDRSPSSNGANQTLARGAGVAYQHQNQNHSHKRDQPGNDDDGVEGMGRQRLMHVGKIPDEFERYDGADSRPGSA
jgi:hypothetical protein